MPDDPRKNSSIDTSLVDPSIDKYSFKMPGYVNASSNPNTVYPTVPQEQILNNENIGMPYGPGDGLAVPHISTFVGLYNAAIKSYYYYFDEALRNSWENSLAMARDPFIKEVRLQREIPPIMLPGNIVPDDPDDDDQLLVAKEFLSIYKNMWRFQNIKKSLIKATFYGKSASHFKLGPKKINGRLYNTVTNHIPINGDKLVYKFDGTPGILIYPEYSQYFEDKYGKDAVEKIVQNTNIAPALFFKTPYLRERFIIHEYNPSDTDYFFEYDMANAVHGIGWRSDFYWGWQILTELKSWDFEGLERVGVNGMLYGFFKTGNPQAKAKVWEALINLQRNNMAVFEVDASWSGQPADIIQRMEPAQVGYDVLYQLITHFEGIIRRGVLGQNLATQSSPTGLGSGLADLHAESKFDVVKADAVDLDEALNSDLTPVLLKNNFFTYKGKTVRGDDLPFGLHYRTQLDDPNIEKVIDAAEKLVNMGVELDGDDLRDRAGFAPPKSNHTTISLARLTMMSQPPLAQAPQGLPENGKPNGKPQGNGKSKAENNGKPKAESNGKPKQKKDVSKNRLNEYDIDFNQITKEELDEAIKDIDENPSEAQKKSGNYKKSHIHWKGLPITIETGKGQTRSGKDKDGKPWSVTMNHSYGYIKKTESEADGDHIDIFLNHDGLDSDKVFVVNQNKEDGSFDEHKCMLGFNSLKEAKEGYLSNYSKDWKGLGSVSEMSLDEFKDWIHDGDTSEPLENEIDRNFMEQENELVDNIATYLVSFTLSHRVRRAAWNHSNWSICIYVDSVDRELTSKLKLIEDTLGLGKVKIIPDRLGSRLEDGYEDIHLDMYAQAPQGLSEGGITIEPFAWREEDHPREPKGSEHGGEFTDKSGEFRKPLKTLSREEVKNSLSKSDSLGKHGKPQDEDIYNIIAPEGEYYLVDVPISKLNHEYYDIDTGERSISEGQEKRVYKYKEMTTEAPPILLVYKSRNKKNKSKQAVVSDGNHRVEVAKQKGLSHVKAFIRKNEYEDWLESNDISEKFSWNESDHPREPKGNEHGGEFKPKSDYDIQDAHYYYDQDDHPGELKHQYIFKLEGKEIGEIAFIPHQGGGFEVSNVQVWPQFRRKGYGESFYRHAANEAEKLGGKLYISNDRTKDAIALHKYFESKRFLEEDGSLDFDNKNIDKFAWNESDHPREPSGKPEGGQFASAHAPQGLATAHAPQGLSKTKIFGKSKARTHISVKDLKESTNHIFKREVDVADLITLAGIPDDADCEILEDKPMGLLIIDSHTDKTSITRTIGRTKYGVYIHNDFFAVKEEYQGKGIGLQVFGRQVEEAIEQGITHIECYAAKSTFVDDKFNGYETWPKFGYDGVIPAHLLYDARHDLKDKSLKRISDLYKTREGYEWWKKNGDSVMLEFDLTEGSYSRRTWDQYLALRKAKLTKKETQSETQIETPEGVEKHRILPNKNLTKSTSYGNQNGVTQKNDGVMICVYPSSSVAKSLVIDEGEKQSDLHMTLFYLGRESELGEEIIDSARKACKVYAEYSNPFDCIIRNLGLFPATEHSDGKEVLYAQVESTELTGFRKTFEDVLKVAQVSYKNNFTFNPHITLRYQEPGAQVPTPHFESQLMKINEIAFVCGEDVEVFRFSKK